MVSSLRWFLDILIVAACPGAVKRKNAIHAKKLENHAKKYDKSAQEIIYMK